MQYLSGIVLKSKAKGNTVSVNVELVVKEEEGPLNRGVSLEPFIPLSWVRWNKHGSPKGCHQKVFHHGLTMSSPVGGLSETLLV